MSNLCGPPLAPKNPNDSDGQTMTRDGDDPTGSGQPHGGRRQPFSSLAAMAWALTQTDPTVPEHKRLVARDQLIEAGKRENVWAASFLAGMLVEAAAPLPAWDPARFLTGRIDIASGTDRDRYLSGMPTDLGLVPQREGAILDQAAWQRTRDSTDGSSWPPLDNPIDPDTCRWQRLVPAGDRDWGVGQLPQLASDLLYDEPIADRALALVSFAVRSATAAQFVIRRIGDEAWQTSGDQGQPFPIRDSAAARAMCTAALEAIGWARRRSSLYLAATDGPEALASAGRFLMAADLVAQFASPGHFASVDGAGEPIPDLVTWMEPGLLGQGPPWGERIVAGMRALVLPNIQ